MRARETQCWWWGRDSLPMWVGVGAGLFVLTLLGIIVVAGAQHGAFQ